MFKEILSWYLASNSLKGLIIRSLMFRVICSLYISSIYNLSPELTFQLRELALLRINNLNWTSSYITRSNLAVYQLIKFWQLRAVQMQSFLPPKLFHATGPSPPLPTRFLLLRSLLALWLLWIFKINWKLLFFHIKLGTFKKRLSLPIFQKSQTETFYIFSRRSTTGVATYPWATLNFISLDPSSITPDV